MEFKILPAILALSLAPVALAQTDTDNSTDSPVITISAYVTPEKADNIGSSVTILDQKDFEERNATYVVDALKTVPGVAIGFLGGRGTATSVFMRGADSDQTLVIIDGVKVNPASGSSFDFGTLPLNGIERIEILRGEQSALWGTDAVGGVIYITTKSGKYANKPFNASINVGGGTHSALDMNATLYGRQGGFYYALAGASNRTDGISAFSSHKFHYTAQDGTEITTGGATEADGFQRSSGSLNLGYEFADAGIEASVSHRSYVTHFDNSLATDSTDNAFTRSRETVLKLDGYIGSAQDLIKQSASVNHVKTHNQTYGTYSSDDTGKKLDAKYQFDLNFDRDGATTQGLTTLLEYQKNTLDTSSDKVLKEKSVAFEYRLFNENDHTFSVSARYDNSEFDNALTYRIAGGYRLSDNFRLHASYGSAVKNPTMIEYYGWGSAWLANTDLKPEKSRGGEAGLLIESTNKKHSLDVTFFKRHVDNLIEVNSTWTQSINVAGTSKIHGIEVAYNGQLTNDLTAYANYTYTHTENASGEELARRPEHQVNAGLHYQATPAFGTDISINYVGNRLNNYNYYDSNSNTYSSYKVDMPSYTLVNLGADYRLNENLKLYAYFNNIFDKKYENVIGYGQDGANFYIGVKGDW